MRILSCVIAGWLMFSAVGCSFSGGGLALFPESNSFLESTEAVMQCAGPLPLPRELDKRPLPPYVVEPGDTLLVQVIEDEDPVILPGDQPVIQDGTIDLGIYGRPVVAGRTLAEIEAIVDRLIRDKTKIETVTVRAVDRPTKVFYVLGEVVTPGAYPLFGNETVLDGILSAGGLGGRADSERVILSRPSAPDGCRVVLPVCYDEIVQLGDTSTNYQLAPGDRIFVASRSVFDCFKKDLCTPCNRPHFPCPVPEIPCALPAAALDPPVIIPSGSPYGELHR